MLRSEGNVESIITVSVSEMELGSAKSGWMCDYRNSGAKYNCIWLQNYILVGSEIGEKIYYGIYKLRLYATYDSNYFLPKPRTGSM